MSAVLEFDGVSCRAPSSLRPHLQGVDLVLARGEIAVLLGGNGAGKTTLLKTAAGLWPSESGAVRIDGASVGGFDPERVGVVLEETRSQFVGSTVAAELSFSLECRAFDQSTIRKRVERQVNRFGLEDLADRDPFTLSVGEQQQCLIAAALISEPPLLLLDDPFTYLGPGVRARLWEHLRTMVREKHVGGVLVTANDAEVAARADRVGVLDDGRLAIWDAPPRVLGGDLPASVFPSFTRWMEGRLTERGIGVSAGAESPEALADRFAADHIR